MENNKIEEETSEEEQIDKEVEVIYRLRDKLMPYQKQVMIVGMLILIALVVFLGFAYGGMRVCSDLDGVLDDKFRCHPNYYNDTKSFDAVGQRFIVPKLEDIMNDTLG